jgi:hypothetical protein
MTRLCACPCKRPLVGRAASAKYETEPRRSPKLKRKTPKAAPVTIRQLERAA